MTTAASTQDTTDRPQSAASRRRRRWIIISVLVTTATLAVVLLWFQPQVLLFDTVVDDDLPTAAPASEQGDPADPTTTADDAGRETPDEGGPQRDALNDGTDTGGDQPARSAAPQTDLAEPSDEPVALLTGTFDSRNRYTVTGRVTAYELPDQTRIVRLEEFESTNGPDLFVYLTVGDATESSDAVLAADHVDLGILRGNVGNQNYDIPPEINLDRYDTVVIWCRRFGTAFGAADLH